MKLKFDAYCIQYDIDKNDLLNDLSRKIGVDKAYLSVILRGKKKPSKRIYRLLEKEIGDYIQLPQFEFEERKYEREEDES